MGSIVISHDGVTRVDDGVTRLDDSVTTTPGLAVDVVGVHVVGGLLS